MKFSVGILYKELSSKTDIPETWSSDGLNLARGVIKFFSCNLNISWLIGMQFATEVNHIMPFNIYKFMKIGHDGNASLRDVNEILPIFSKLFIRFG